MTGRHYTIDGERLPSVTTVLGVLEKSGLAKWRGSVGNQEADRIGREAADYGTGIHQLVERVNRGDAGPFGEPEDTVVAPYRAWLTEHVACVLGAERLCISRRYKFAGTCDAVVVMNGDSDATVVDVKTSRTPLGVREWRAQLAAYALALAEDGIVCRRRIILRMPKAEQGEMYIHELPEDDLEIDQRAFLACLRLFHWSSGVTPIARPVGMRIRMNGARP